MRLIEKIERTAQIELLSGLHIGDSDDSSSIGGVDSPVVRLKIDRSPYIPGSSLKGKMRSLIEITNGVSKVGDDAAINKIFGSTESKKFHRKAEISRLIFRDCRLSDKSIKEIGKLETDLPFTEIKWENTIDRIKGVAKNGGLRQTERVVAGAFFDFMMIINVYEVDDKQEILKCVDQCFSLLEMDYLGGSGTRGYGQIKFHNIQDNTIWNA